MTMKKIVTTSATILCLLALVVATVFAISSKFHLPGGWRIFSVVTGSMVPLMKEGTLIVTQSPKSSSEITAGTIITYAKPGESDKLITHRVVDEKGTENNPQYVTKGDANPESDPWLVPYKNVAGIYKTQTPYLGALFQYLRSKPGIVVFILLPVLYLAWQEIRTIISILVDREIQERMGEVRPRSPNVHLGMIVLLGLALASVSYTYALFTSKPAGLSRITLSAFEATVSPSPVGESSPTPTPTTPVSPLINP
jgi:signal peptidase